MENSSGGEFKQNQDAKIKSLTEKLTEAEAELSTLKHFMLRENYSYRIKELERVLEEIKFEDENADNLTSYTRDLILDVLARKIK